MTCVECAMELLFYFILRLKFCNVLLGGFSIMCIEGQGESVRIDSGTAILVSLLMPECQSFVLARFSQKDRCFNAFDKR